MLVNYGGSCPPLIHRPTYSLWGHVHLPLLGIRFSSWNFGNFGRYLVCSVYPCNFQSSKQYLTQKLVHSKHSVNSLLTEQYLTCCYLFVHSVSYSFGKCALSILLVLGTLLCAEAPLVNETKSLPSRNFKLGLVDVWFWVHLWFYKCVVLPAKLWKLVDQRLWFLLFFYRTQESW